MFPSGRGQCLAICLSVVTRGRYAIAPRWAEARSAAGHTSTHKTAAATKGPQPPESTVPRLTHASAPWLSNPTPRCAHPREIMYMSIKDKHKNPGGSCIHKSPKLKTVQKSTDRIMGNTLQYLYIGMLHSKIKIDCYIHLRYNDELRAQTKTTGNSNRWWQKSEHGYPWGREVLPGKARRDSLHLGLGGLGSSTVCITPQWALSQATPTQDHTACRNYTLTRCLRSQTF